MPKKNNANSLISELKRKIRRSYYSEEKTRIVIDGMCGEMTIAELCRKEGIAQTLYYKWSKDFKLLKYRYGKIMDGPDKDKLDNLAEKKLIMLKQDKSSFLTVELISLVVTLKKH